MKFSDIPQFTRSAHYYVNVSWEYLQDFLDQHAKNYPVNLSPDYQRDHVWTEEQEIKYIEYILRGGNTGKDIHFNCPGWHTLTSKDQTLELVDGKQRLKAVMRFMNNEIPAFGTYRKDFTGSMRLSKLDFVVHINDLKARKEVLQWYVDMNAGGTVHKSEEIDKVKKMIEDEK